MTLKDELIDAVIPNLSEFGTVVAPQHLVFREDLIRVIEQLKSGERVTPASAAHMFQELDIFLQFIKDSEPPVFPDRNSKKLFMEENLSNFLRWRQQSVLESALRCTPSQLEKPPRRI